MIYLYYLIFKCLIHEIRFQLLDFVSESMSSRHNEMHSIVPQSPTDSDEGLSFNKIDFNELHDIFNKIRNFKPKNIREIVIKPNLKTLTDIYKYFDVAGEVLPGNDVCATPYNQLAVSTNGDVYWHMRCYNDYKLGNIYENDLNDIFYGYSAALFRSEFKNANMCMAACTRCCGIMSNDRVY